MRLKLSQVSFIVGTTNLPKIDINSNAQNELLSDNLICIKCKW